MSEAKTQKQNFKALKKILQDADKGFNFDSHPANDAGAVAFNMLCVIEKVRPAMLYQAPEDESDEQSQENSLQLAAANKALATSLSKFFAQKTPWVTVLEDDGDIFVYHKDLQPKVDKLKNGDLTDILGLCTKMGNTTFRIKLNGHGLYGNACDEDEGLESFSSHYIMFSKMKKMASNIEESLQLIIVFSNDEKGRWA